jgi:enoyl-[acyl-carrier protein] reductase III
MDSSFYAGKTALITGSGRGIGRAIALHFANLGVNIVVNYFRNRESAEETVREIDDLGVKVELVKANVGDLEDIDLLMGETERVFGGLDFLISNAGSGYNRPILEQRPKGWNWTMDINARAYLFLAQKAVPLMEKRGGGWMVAISSPGSFRVLPEYAVVGASKAAIESLTRYMAVEFASRNIIVNAISPGIVATEALQHFNTMQDEDLLEEIADQTPAG